MFIYSLFDRVARQYGALVTGPNDETVVRGLIEIRNTGSQVDRYPKDFDLMVLGEFDDVSGEIRAVLPRFVVNVGAQLAAPLALES